ncbi:Uncharacterized protein FWK35_00022125, partial [Aphis craccivora]
QDPYSRKAYFCVQNRIGTGRLKYFIRVAAKLYDYILENREKPFFLYGLYSAFAGCIVYTVFGSCKDITIGPTALMSLMTYQQVFNRNADYAVLLCFLSGILQFIMGSLKLGMY